MNGVGLLAPLFFGGDPGKTTQTVPFDAAPKFHGFGAGPWETAF